jgi:DNA-binding response OmpR family regulator
MASAMPWVDRPILVVDGDRVSREIVRAHLEQEGFAVREATDAEDAVSRVAEQLPALVVLDVMLPDGSGLQVCRRLRGAEATRTLPIIMLTARDSEVDRVIGLELGADDYVTKPFSPTELVARVRAVLRRAARDPAQSAPGHVQCGRLLISLEGHDTWVDGRPVALSLREFELLGFFVQHSGKTFSREQLREEIWPGTPPMSERSVDVHVRRLRERLERVGIATDAIVTVRGVGYRFDPSRVNAR